MKYVMRRPAVAVEKPDCVSAVLLVVYGKRLSVQNRQSKSLTAEGEVAAAPRTGATAYQGRGLISTPPAPCRAIDEGVGKAPLCYPPRFQAASESDLPPPDPRQSLAAGGFGMAGQRRLPPKLMFKSSTSSSSNSAEMYLGPNLCQVSKTKLRVPSQRIHSKIGKGPQFRLTKDTINTSSQHRPQQDQRHNLAKSPGIL